MTEGFMKWIKGTSAVTAGSDAVARASAMKSIGKRGALSEVKSAQGRASMNRMDLEEAEEDRVSDLRMDAILTKRQLRKQKLRKDVQAIWRKGREEYKKAETPKEKKKIILDHMRNSAARWATTLQNVPNMADGPSYLMYLLVHEPLTTQGKITDNATQRLILNLLLKYVGAGGAEGEGEGGENSVEDAEAAKVMWDAQWKLFVSESVGKEPKITSREEFLTEMEKHFVGVSNESESQGHPSVRTLLNRFKEKFKEVTGKTSVPVVKPTPAPLTKEGGGSRKKGNKRTKRKSKRSKTKKRKSKKRKSKKRKSKKRQSKK